MNKLLLYSLMLLLGTSTTIQCGQVNARTIYFHEIIQGFDWANSPMPTNEMNVTVLQQKVEILENNLTLNWMIATAVVLFLLILLIFQQLRAHRIVKQKSETIAQHRNMMYSTICIQEQEYRQMADEIHNGVGALLSTIKLNISNVNMRFNHFGIETEMIQKTRLLLDLAIGNVRYVSKTLSPATPKTFGLGQALEDLLQKISDELGIATETSIDLQRKVNSVELELGLYRSVRILLFHAIQHSQPEKIILNLNYSEDRLFLILQIAMPAIHSTGDQKSLNAQNNFDLRSFESQLTMMDGKIEEIENADNHLTLSISLPLHKTFAA